MRSSRVRKPAMGVSLFPFLAVLICTMGAIIVLLIMVVQQARVQAQAETREPVEPAASESSTDELKQQEEEYQWRREMLEKQRAELAQKLADERLELGHLDDHIRRLQDQCKRLVAQAEELNRTGQTKPGDPSLAVEQARLQQALDVAKRDLDEAKKKVSTKPRSFAIIPYKGPSGTFRRPIYIECRGDSIIFQPEGVTLVPSDFDGPLGPGNPFDAALRATREYLASAGKNQGGEPYPLLVVRPDGAVAYALARSAMKSWDDEFGYELIDQEMKLAFPPPDPQLGLTLQRALGDARRRQEMLAKVAPSRFKGVGSSRGRGAGDGEGFNEHYGIGAARDDSGEPGATGGTGGKGPGAGGLAASGARTGGFGAGTGERGKTGTGAGTGVGGGPGLASGPAKTGGFAGGPGGGGSAGGFYGDKPPFGKPGPFAKTGTGGSATTGSGGQGTAATGGGAGNSAAPGSTQAGGGEFVAAGEAGKNASGGTVNGTPGNKFARGAKNAAGGQAGEAGQAGGSGGGSGSPPGAQGGMPTINLAQDDSQGEAKASSDKKPSKARRRSSNWGLPNSAANAVGYTRPIRISCSAEKLVILPERGDGKPPQVVKLTANTEAPIEDFVGAVWKHMDSWGIAGQRAYWKPVLSVQVAPGGEERFAELESQLRGSGLEVKRK